MVFEFVLLLLLLLLLVALSKGIGGDPGGTEEGDEASPTADFS